MNVDLVQSIDSKYIHITIIFQDLLMNAQLMYSIISIAIFKINTCNFILYYIPLRQACDHNHNSAIHRKAHCTVLFENLLLLINSTVQLKREKMNRPHTCDYSVRYAIKICNE